MENRDFDSIDEVDDISSKEEYRRCMEVGMDEKKALEVISHYSRDNGRTPFQWTDGPNAGFTSGTPWLALNSNYNTINAAEQEKRQNSVLSFYKKLIALRKNVKYAETIVYGKTIPVLEEESNIMAYYRADENQKIFVIGNFDNNERWVEIPDLDHNESRSKWVVLLNNCDQFQITDNKVVLEPHQALVLLCV